MPKMDLRTMTLGEVLDRTFSLYKGNFWLFGGIAAIPYLLLAAAGMLYSSASRDAMMASHGPGISANLAYSIGAVLGTLALFGIVTLLAFTAVQAATVVAVSELYLGRPARIGQSYGRVRGRFVTVLLAVVLIILLTVPVGFGGILVSGLLTTPLLLLLGLKSASTWIFAAVALLGSILTMTALAVLLCHVALAIPVATLEPVGPGRAISRSYRLMRRHAAQVFAVYVLVLVLSVVTYLVFNLPFLLAQGSIFKPHALPIDMQILQGLSGWVGAVLVAPIGPIAISLIYYNQRVRKEAFDLEQLMASLDPRETPPTLSPA